MKTVSVRREIKASQGATVLLCTNRSAVSLFLLLGILSLSTIGMVILTPDLSYGESPAEAISRIRQRPHAQMPPPQTTYARAPAGKGMTIENGTGYLLKVHFSGVANHTVEVPDGKSVGVDLVVGNYEVAAEVPGSSITPFYGKQAYQPNTHYWLKFYVQRMWK